MSTCREAKNLQKIQRFAYFAYVMLNRKVWCKKDTFVCVRQLLYLSEHGDKMKFDLKVARVEASHCDDLVNQAAYHIRRATAADQLLKTQQAEQEKERLAMKMKQEKEEVRSSIFFKVFFDGL